MAVPTKIGYGPPASLGYPTGADKVTKIGTGFAAGSPDLAGPVIIPLIVSKDTLSGAITNQVQFAFTLPYTIIPRQITWSTTAVTANAGSADLYDATAAAQVAGSSGTLAVSASPAAVKVSPTHGQIAAGNTIQVRASSPAASTIVGLSGFLIADIVSDVVAGSY